MVSSAVGWNGVSKPFFVRGRNFKSKYRSYLEHLRNDIIPDMKDFYRNNNFICIEESAPPHRAKIVQNFLREEL